MPLSPGDEQTLEKGIPYIRSICAFFIYLRDRRNIDRCYATADQFIEQLKEDLKKK